jgi:hypothetical protein
VVIRTLAVIVIGFGCRTAAVAQQQAVALERLVPSVTLQTGFVSTFQLTLGGTFGDGPAWQNRVMLDFNSVAIAGRRSDGERIHDRGYAEPAAS